MSSTSGTKVENPGTITSDSLAAESVNQGGSFAAGSDNREPSGVPSKSTTANNTDTSGATTLDAAPDAPSRLDPSNPDQDDILGSSRGSTSTGQVAGQAYASVAGSGLPDTQKPKGSNLSEGGFDSGAPNASFNTDIGSKKDPGRVALQEMADNVPVPGVASGPRQTEITNDGQFDALKDESA